MTGPSPEPEAWVVWGTSRGRDGSPQVIASHGSGLPAPLRERPETPPEESVFVGRCEWSSMPGFDGDAHFTVEHRDGCWYLWHTVIEFVEVETADPDRNDDEDQDEDEDQRDTWVDVEPVVTGQDCVAACRWPGVPKETVAEVLFSKAARLILQGDRRVAGAGMDFFKGDAEIGIAAWNRAKAELEQEQAIQSGPVSWVVWDTTASSSRSPTVLASFGTPVPPGPFASFDPENSLLLGSCGWPHESGLDWYGRFVMSRQHGFWCLWQGISLDPDDGYEMDHCVAACLWPGAPAEVVGVMLFSKFAKFILTNHWGHRVGEFRFRDDAELCEAGMALAREELNRSRSREPGQVG